MISRPKIPAPASHPNFPHATPVGPRCARPRLLALTLPAKPSVGWAVLCPPPRHLPIHGAPGAPRPTQRHPLATAKSGEVLINFSKDGRTGVLIQGQTANETEWTFVGTDTSDPYHDTRPLKVSGQPEKRRYRVCFWDGDPTNVWSPVIEVVFGG